MKLHAQIPHGCYLVEVGSRPRWDAIRLNFYMKGLLLRTEDVQPDMEESHPTIGEADLMLIASTNPHDVRRMREVCAYLGLATS